MSDELSGADLLEHLMREEQSNSADYIIDEIEASLLKDENSAFRIGGNSLRMSQVANGSSCSIEHLEKKNSMAKLVCPNGNGKNPNGSDRNRHRSSLDFWLNTEISFR